MKTVKNHLTRGLIGIKNEAAGYWLKISKASFVSALAILVLALASSGSALAQTDTWTGTSGTSWNTSGNWNSGAGPTPTNTSTAYFNSTGGGNTALSFSGATSLENMTFDVGASAYTIGLTSGPTLTLTNSGTIQTTAADTNAQNINAPITLGSNYTFLSNATSTNATLNFGGAITGAANTAITLTLAGTNTGTNTISGLLDNGSGTGSVALNVYSSGLWILAPSGQNTYGGTTTIGTTNSNGGTLEVNANGNSGSSVLKNNTAFTFNGGKFDYNSSNGNANSQTIGAITINAGANTIENDETDSGGGGTSGLTVGAVSILTTAPTTYGGTLNFVTTGGATITASSGVALSANIFYNGGYAYAPSSGTVTNIAYVTGTDTLYGSITTTNYTSLSNITTSGNFYYNLEVSTTGSGSSSGGTSIAFGTNSLTFTANNRTIVGSYLVNGGPSGYSETINSSNGGDLTGISSGGGEIVFMTSGTNDLLTVNAEVGNENSTTAYSSVVKSGLGTMIFAGTNEYSGGTYVDQGMLEVTRSNNVTGGGLGFGGSTYATKVFTGTAMVYGGGTLDLASTSNNTITDEAVTLAGGSLINTSTTNTATLDNGVAGIELISTGTNATTSSNYAVIFSGGGSGSGAAANVSTTSNSTITGLQTTAAGSGYTSTPTASFSNAPGLTGSSNTVILSSLALDGTANTIGGAGNLTINAVLSGSGGGFTKIGTGKLILTGSNTYTGTTTINAGTLDLQNVYGGSLAAGSAVTVNNGGTLGVGSVGGTGTAAGTVAVAGGGTINVNGGGTGTLNTGALTLNGTSGSGTDDLTFSLTTSGATTTLDDISVTGSVTFSSAGGTVIAINNLNGTPNTGDYNLIVTSTGVVNSTNVVLSTNSLDGETLSLAMGTGTNSNNLQLDITGGASAPAVAYWTGTNSTSWTVAGNFSTTNTSNVPASAVPGSATDVVFGTSSPTPTNLSTVLNAPTTINSLTFATSSNVSIAPGASATNTLTLEAATTTGSNGINVAPNGIKVNSGAGTVAISASVVLGTNQTWTNSSANSLTVSGNVSGGFGLTTAGSGTIALTTNNNYTGGTTITAGVLAINSVAASGSAQSLGTGSNLTLAGVSSSSNATLDYTGGTATFGQNITVSNGDYGTVENGGSGVLNLSGSISKNGSVLTLSGGKFVVSGVISGTSNNSDLDLNATTVALSNTNSYNGPTSIANGSYLLTAVNNALPTPTNTAVTFGLPTDSGVTNTLDLMGNNETVASLNVGSTNSNVVSQVISSASTVNGSNITISGSPSGTVGTLTVATTTNDTFSGSLGGSGSATNFNLVKSGTGTLVLSGTNTYTGSTTITGGGIDVTGSTLSTAIGVGNGGTLSGTGFVGAITVNSGGILSPGAAPYNLQPKLSASSNNVLTGTSLTVHGGSILSYNLYNATGNTGTALSPAGGTVVNLGLGAFDLAGDVTSGAPVIINLNNTASAGFGTITDGIPNVYNLVEFGSGDTNITLADLTNGDFDITNLSSVLNPANSAYLTLTNLGDGQEALQLDVVPEPGTWALFGLGLLVVYQRKRRRS